MGPSALELALALHETPSLALATRQLPLPADVFGLIRIAANDGEALRAAAERSGAPPAHVLEAARLYLEHALFHPGADHYRVLGVLPGASADTLREHQRWLLRWLHPDRGDDWDSVYASRVMSAFQQLREPGRRQAYDDALYSAGEHRAPEPAALMRPVWTARKLESGPRSRRLLPVVAALGALALVIAFTGALSPGDGNRAPVPDTQAGAAGVAAGSSVAPAQSQAVSTQRAPPRVGDSQATPAAGDAARAPAIPAPAMIRPATPAASASSDVAGTVAGAVDAPGVVVEPAAAAGPASPTVGAVAPTGSPTEAAAPGSTTGPMPVASGTSTAGAIPDARLAPAPPSAGPAHAPPTVQAGSADALTVPGEQAIARLMRHFERAYAAADIDGLMALFARDARHVRGGRAEIREDYAGLFRASRQRQLELDQLRWQRSDTEATGHGPFVAVITPARGAPVAVHGQMRVAVVSEAGEARIQSLWHEEGTP